MSLLYALWRSTMTTSKTQKTWISITCVKNPHLQRRVTQLFHHKERQFHLIIVFTFQVQRKLHITIFKEIN